MRGEKRELVGKELVLSSGEAQAQQPLALVADLAEVEAGRVERRAHLSKKGEGRRLSGDSNLRFLAWRGRQARGQTGVATPRGDQSCSGTLLREPGKVRKAKPACHRWARTPSCALNTQGPL